MTYVDDFAGLCPEHWDDPFKSDIPEWVLPQYRAYYYLYPLGLYNVTPISYHLSRCMYVLKYRLHIVMCDTHNIQHSKYNINSLLLCCPSWWKSISTSISLSEEGSDEELGNLLLSLLGLRFVFSPNLTISVEYLLYIWQIWVIGTTLALPFFSLILDFTVHCVGGCL
jgi:hypothetical protein